MLIDSQNVNNVAYNKKERKKARSNSANIFTAGCFESLQQPPSSTCSVEWMGWSG